jgi:hypothetical protein
LISRKKTGTTKKKRTVFSYAKAVKIAAAMAAAMRVFITI